MVSYAIITGASSGFGAAIARVLAEEGFGLILLARRKDRLEALQQQLLGINPNVITHCLDVRDVKAVEQWCNQVDSSIKERVEVLVNNAGLAAGRNTIDEGLLSDWEEMIDTNLKGLLYVTKAVLPWMKIRNTGIIINITSIAGKEAYPQGNVYCATKAAVDHLTKSMRIDLLPHGIRVSSIAPGAAETEFSLVRFKGDSKAAKAVYQGFQPLVAQDIAETVRFIVTRPPHVSIHDLVIMPAAQASATHFRRD
ncbi:MAG: SDR family NAD(P)-dependent oxidoreductase [Bacteroidetes bacterium]|nr:SDR family NAD(P)-dependent oxidoreductase [Bacteroidota bacterium]MBM3424784.1 SDR family NAD(P)-dependent oxidoreductase [Bacteroidota bacterium]